MTKRNFNLRVLLLSALAVFAISCSTDTSSGDDPFTPASGEGTELNGTMNEDRTLDPNQDYVLTGTFSVSAGATLTIPAGTKIVANVEAGASSSTYIVVQKGGKINVQGTANSPVVMTSNDKSPGDWGGLVIAGDATTTEGTNATAEIGQITYGGSNDTDNSGSISHLIINYAGAQINAESQFNGLTLYAVGSETTIENVAILNGTDDGVEFFGGTVSVTNLYLENNEDDAVDWTEGWNGTLTNTYVLHSKAGFSTAVEADGINGNPKLINFTAISSVGGTALQFKKTSGATVTGLSLAGYDLSLDMKDNGPLANIKIDGTEANMAKSYIAAPTVDLSTFAWVNSTTNIETSVLTGSVTTDLTLDASITYYLDQTLSIESGAKLTIPAGTKIIADVETGNETNTYILIQKGARIDVQGTQDAPVVMTSTKQTPGDWGGLVIAGEATTTEGTNATAEVGQISYGGTNNVDNSGSISYLIINYAGAQINAESQFNGLTMYAVGSGTTIENVAILNGTDDGVEFFGGTVAVTNLYLENNEDDAVDWTEGWSGSVTNTYVLHNKAGFSTAVEADGANGNPTFTNFTAISTVDGIGLQFKKNTGATMTNVSISGYATNVDMKDNGPVANIIVDGRALTTANDDVFNGTPVDINIFAWATGK